MSEAAVIPLESNPEIFTNFARSLGVSPLLGFTDIYSISDPDLLSFIPRPTYAIILLFPISEKYEALKNDEESKRQSVGTSIDELTTIKWFKQQLKNSCGLYALLHVLCNLPTSLLINQSKIANFVNKDLTSIPDVSNSNNFDKKLKLISDLSLELYSGYSNEGQTEAPPAEDDVNLHFICFTKSPENGHIFELDGRRNGPLDLGKDLDESANGFDKSDVLSSKLVLERIQSYMDMADDTDKLNFAMMGLCPAYD